jgi:hypothetical protein
VRAATVVAACRQSLSKIPIAAKIRPTGTGQSAMDAGRFPTFFSLCKAVDSQLYLRTIVDELRTPLVVPRVYDRFITEICAVRPALIITTNADQCLEQHSNLPTALPRHRAGNARHLPRRLHSQIARLYECDQLIDIHRGRLSTPHQPTRSPCIARTVVFITNRYFHRIGYAR